MYKTYPICIINDEVTTDFIMLIMNYVINSVHYHIIII